LTSKEAIDAIARAINANFVRDLVNTMSRYLRPKDVQDVYNKLTQQVSQASQFLEQARNIFSNLWGIYLDTLSELRSKILEGV